MVVETAGRALDHQLHIGPELFGDDVDVPPGLDVFLMHASFETIEAPMDLREAAIDVREAAIHFRLERRDGKEFYYVAPDERLMAVPVAAAKTGRTLDIGAALPLFRTNLVAPTANGVISVAAGPKQQYDVAADGRFLMNVPVTESTAPTPISIVVNWPATLGR